MNRCEVAGGRGGQAAGLRAGWVPGPRGSHTRTVAGHVLESEPRAQAGVITTF